MKLAYFIMLHHKPEQFLRLMDMIYDPRDTFLIHVDAKTALGLRPSQRDTFRKIKTIIAGKPNVKLMRSRFTNWGGWSLSSALLDAIRILLGADAEWDRFINLSGQCLPLKPLETVRGTLAASRSEFVEMRPFTSLPPDDWHLRSIRMFETPVKALILPGRVPEPRDFALDHKGSQWCMLTREFCEWALSSDLLQTVRRDLKRTLLSDELIIQALVRNGPFAERLASDYGREIIWPGPQTMTMKDWPRLEKTSALFGRKFDIGVDPDVVERLAAKIKHVETHSAISTRS